MSVRIFPTHESIRRLLVVALMGLAGFISPEFLAENERYCP